MKLSEAKTTLLGCVRASIKVSNKKNQDLKRFIKCLERTNNPRLRVVAAEMRQFCPSEPTIVEYVWGVGICF